MSALTHGAKAPRIETPTRTRREHRPDRRRAPRGPAPDARATEQAIERLWAVVGR